ncbi:hypothetical protein [Prochlorococcus sp. MIT 1307]|uniref:hypothetical protein n=1 Tax=Prochlorococcus sp. MIT 1307 TaxID=3096219 RepID=UPI002A755F82|nr:hypothetical protein [Prochlorococcus sp. MIT 1307]
MTIIPALFVIIVIGIILLERYKKLRPSPIKLRKKFSNITAWMEMSREERHAWDEKHKKTSMEKKKMLLGQIRKEYVALSKRKSMS